MNAKMTQMAYLLGISLLLTSILYFFASNWPSFERMTKISLVLLLLILFYMVHLLLKKWVKWQPFLSNWALIAASIVFGIAVALVGQVYNSHADSYELFLIWLIPVLMLAIITNYVPFHVLSYVLSQLTMLFFLFPSSFSLEWESDVQLLMLLGVILFNAALFYIAYHGILGKTILYLTYIMFSALAFYVAVNETFPFHLGLNIMYLLILIGATYYWSKQRLHKGLLTITSIFASAYLLFRTVDWVLRHYGEFALYALLFLAIGFTFLGGVIAGLLNKNKMNRYLVNVLTVSITIVTTLFAIVAITGIFFIIFPEATAVSLYFFALLALIVPGLFIQMSSQYRYSLLGTGFLLAFFTGLVSEYIVYQVILLVPLGIGVYTIKQKGVKVLAFLLTNIVSGYILLDLFSSHIMFFFLFVLNTAYYLLFIKEKATNNTAFLIATVSFLSLTFIDTTVSLQLIYNGIFLLGVPLFIFILSKNKEKAEWITMLVLWFVFLGEKYYEYLWTLLHKSIVALVLGLIFIGIAYLFDRPNKTAAPTGSVVIYKKSFLIGIIVLQLGFVSFQSFTSEKLLQEGEEIKLELAPVDPRSMLQGDYLSLNYDINRIDENIPAGNVKVVLRQEDDVYRYAGYYQIDQKWNKEYDKQPDDVIINGKANGYDRVHYGIETFFIPEGTGLKLEKEIDYAYVRVGKSGDAIIENVE